MVIELSPEIEQALIAEARSRGVPLDALIREALAALALRSAPSVPGDWDTEIEALLDTLPEMPVLPDRALSREAI
jgi:hypothetical protein